MYLAEVLFEGVRFSLRSIFFSVKALYFGKLSILIYYISTPQINELSDNIFETCLLDGVSKRQFVRIMYFSALKTVVGRICALKERKALVKWHKDHYIV